MKQVPYDPINRGEGDNTPRRGRRLSAAWHDLAIRSETTLARIVLDQERESDAGHEGKNAEHQVGAAPA